MPIFNMHEAKTHLSRLVERVVAGEEIVIARAGTPLVRIIPYEPKRKERVFGQDKGLIRIADDFDHLPADIQIAFDGLEA